MTDRAEIMPAATSHEDIYNQTSSSNSLSSSFCSPSSYLPDYMMMFTDAAHQHPLLDRSSVASCNSLKQPHQQAKNNNSNQANQQHRNHHQNNQLHHQQQKQTNLSGSHTHSYHRHYSPYQPFRSSDLFHSNISLCFDDDYEEEHVDESNQERENYYAEADDDILYCAAPHRTHSHDIKQQHNEQEPLANQLYQETMTPPTHHYLTIEELKSARTSCWLCGCNWQQDHVSLDCPECGGYALSRPCPSCDGQCKQVWKRNINGTHDCHKASWVGECTIKSSPVSSADDKQQQHKQVTDCQKQEPTRQQVASGITSSVCSSQPSSAASSDSELDCHQEPSSPTPSSIPKLPPQVNPAATASSQKQSTKSQQQQAATPAPPSSSSSPQHPNHLCVCN